MPIKKEKVDREIDLSISIVSFEAKEYVRRCLASILRHTTNMNVEIFVIDNVSKDGTPDMVEREFPKVRLVRNRVNVGFAAGNNQALAQSRGQYFVVLDPDTEVKADTFQTMISFMDAHPEVGLLGPKMLNADGSLQPSYNKRFPNLLDLMLAVLGIRPFIYWLYKKTFFKKFFLERLYAGHQREQEIAWSGGACLLARRNAINEVGGLDERYFLYLEETDWCFEFWRHGWKIYYIPQAEIIHHWGKTTERRIEVSSSEGVRSNLRFFSKHSPRAFRWLVPCLALVGIFLRISWAGLGYLLFRRHRKTLGLRLKGYRMGLRIIFEEWHHCMMGPSEVPEPAYLRHQMQKESKSGSRKG